MKKLAIDKAKLIAVCQRNGVAFLGVFGSFATGEATSESDVDFLVRFSKRKSLVDLVRIEREFAEALRREVDLLTEASISPYLRDRINAEVEAGYSAGRVIST